jgi:hypothetical protein
MFQTIGVPAWAFWCAVVYLLVGQIYLSVKMGNMLRQSRLRKLQLAGDPGNNGSQRDNDDNGEPISPRCTRKTTDKTNECSAAQEPNQERYYPFHRFNPRRFAQHYGRGK